MMMDGLLYNVKSEFFTTNLSPVTPDSVICFVMYSDVIFKIFYLFPTMYFSHLFCGTFFFIHFNFLYYHSFVNIDLQI